MGHERGRESQQGREQSEETERPNRREFLAGSVGALAAARINKKFGRFSSLSREGAAQEKAPTAAAPRRVIIDTDPGVDDALAILLASAVAGIAGGGDHAGGGKCAAGFYAAECVEAGGDCGADGCAGGGRGASSAGEETDYGRARSREQRTGGRGISGAEDQAGGGIGAGNDSEDCEGESGRDFDCGGGAVDECGAGAARRSGAGGEN